MKINLLDIDNVVKQNNLPKITNPIFFNQSNYPTEDGLFSYEIFGEIGSKSRSNQFAYIDLNTRIFHPVVYKLIISLDKRIEECISGLKYFTIKDGQLVEDDVNGETGVSFLYNNFEKLSFKKTESLQRDSKLNIIEKFDKDTLFINKFIVIPPFLRDFNPNTSKAGRIADVDEINDLYAKLIRFGSSLDGESSFSFVRTNTESQMQTIIYDVYKTFIDYISGKNGLVHRGLLGKSIDYATRSVISAPRSNTNRWDDTEIKFGTVGIPLSQVCALFFPFFVKYINDFIDIHIEEFSNVKNKKGEDVFIDNVKNQFTDKDINKLVSNFIKNIPARFKAITVKDDKGNEYPVEVFHTDLDRNFTITDLLYIAAIDITSDKHVYCTRYPVDNYQSIFPSKIVVLSTNDTEYRKIEDRYLENYPIIFPDYPVAENYFTDSLVINNSLTAALGADYDGDTLSIRGVFSAEANKEADQLINAKTNILSQQGESISKVGNEAVLSLYTLTK
ncbi:DNA-directed RNA polymerase subunit gamma [Listeria phage LPJP1]|nr:DNA-directed RNA polymerase subunit gamma [Listeria phage LPJP1]